jgi:hypothetical protein
MASLSRRTFLGCAAALPAARAASFVPVKAKRKPADAWQDYPTRTLDQLKGFRAGARAPQCDAYGGREDRHIRASGFFRVEKIQDRWWLVDPQGRLFLHVGVVSVTPGNSGRNRAQLAARFGTEQHWAGETSKLLRHYGFNGTGNWSASEILRAAPSPLVYTVRSDFLGSFGRKHALTHQQPGHLGYPNDVIPVFHPGFEPFCDEYARSVTGRRDDAFLLGYFSDNELPAPGDVLEKSMALDAGDARLAPGRHAAEQWIARRKGAAVPVSDLTAEDREAFREYLFERYFSATTKALRKHDGNHLCLGPRLHGVSLRSPGVMRAAGRHLDVIATNVYGQWSIDASMLDMWRKEAGKPFLVTEFYAKGMDSGFPNNTGAGWVVATQQDRGWFYQNFTLSLLESKQCVGWHWFKYMDNDPEDLTTDPSNRDSNKGIVKIDYQPYEALLQPMAALNREVYRLADYFDRETK